MDLNHPDLLNLLSRIIPEEYYKLCMINKQSLASWMYAYDLKLKRMPDLTRSKALRELVISGELWCKDLLNIPDGVVSLYVTGDESLLANSDLAYMPSGLKCLYIRNECTITTFSALKYLQTLIVREIVVDFAAIPDTLTRLEALYDRPIDMALLPRSLTTLVLSSEPYEYIFAIRNVDKCPRLTKLDVIHGILSSDQIEQLPDSIEVLSATLNITRTTRFPENLIRLTTSGHVSYAIVGTHKITVPSFMADASTLQMPFDVSSIEFDKHAAPKVFDVSDLQALSSKFAMRIMSTLSTTISDLPSTLVSLRLLTSKTMTLDSGTLPCTLTQLELTQECTLINLSCLPNLQSLDYWTQNFTADEFTAMPSKLTALSIDAKPNATYDSAFFAHLPRSIYELKSHTKIVDLRGLPDLNHIYMPHVPLTIDNIHLLPKTLKSVHMGETIITDELVAALWFLPNPYDRCRANCTLFGRKFASRSRY